MPSLSENRDRVFRIIIKYENKISFFDLENLLNGRDYTIPYNSIQALDVILRHFPSMK